MCSVLRGVARGHIGDRQVSQQEESGGGTLGLTRATPVGQDQLAERRLHVLPK